MEAMSIRVVPANEASPEDLDLIFGTRGGAAECRCQRYRLARGEAFGNTPVEHRIDRLREQTCCGDADAADTSGLVAYLDQEPVGWCAVAPRCDYEGLVRNSNQTAWRGREEDRSDPTVWAVTCLFTRAGHRRRGVAATLAEATIEFARSRGARRLEAYPITDDNATWGEEHPGRLTTYLKAGFEIVHRPSKRRAVVAVEL